MSAIVTNNASSTLASNILSGATSIPLSTGSGALFPNPTGAEYFYVRLGDDTTNEVVKCTARTTDTITCVATASAWSGTTPVILTFCKEVYDEIPKIISSDATYTVRTSGGNFTTVASALTAIRDTVIAEDAIVTIEIDDGEWTQSASINDDLVSSGRVILKGRNLYTTTMTSVQSSSGSTGNWSVIINVASTSNIAANDYVQIIANSGGTYPALMIGMHKVTSVDVPNSRITLNVLHPATTICSGAVSGTIYVIKTRLKFNASLFGFTLRGNGFKELTRMALVGAGTAGYTALSIGGRAVNQQVSNVGITAFAGYAYSPSDVFTAVDHLIERRPIIAASSQQRVATAEEIQPALDRAASLGGGIVYVPPGTYTLTKTLTIGDNVTIRADPGALFINGNNLGWFISNDADGVTGGYTANKNIVIDGGIWDANSFDMNMFAFGHATGVTVKNATFKNNLSDAHCIEYNAIKDGQILNCKFIDCGNPTTGTEAIQLDLMKGSTQFSRFGPYDNTPCENILIDGCTFTGCQRGIGSHSVTLNVRHTRIKITECDFYDLDQEAIRIENWSDFVISGNTFKTCYSGIKLESTDATTNYGYVISNNVFNNITGAEARAIWVIGTQSQSYHRRGIISGNTINGSAKHGIALDFVLDFIVSNNMLDSVDRVGIWLWDSSYCTITNNQVLACGTYYSPKRSIYIGSSSLTGSDGAGSCVQNVVTGNTCEGLTFDYTTKSIGTQNVTTAHFTVDAHAVTCQKYSNLIAGTWTA